MEPPSVVTHSIAILFWDGHVAISPSLVAAINALANARYSVDVFVRSPDANYLPPPSFDEERVRVIEITDRQGMFIPPRSFWEKARRRIAEHFDRVRFVRRARREQARRGYDAIIGIDDFGVVLGRAMANRDGVPFIHWSLELEPHPGVTDPVRTLQRWLAVRDRASADLTIVQDEVRLRGLNPATLRGDIAFVPNSPAGPSVASAARLFHEKFALDPRQIVILHAGGITPLFCSAELAAAAADWPSAWTLVFHERERRDPGEPYLREVAAAGQGRVRLSLDPVPYERLDEIFSSADVSVILYRGSAGENFRRIGAASGKLAHSLRVGVPVICLRTGDFEAIVDRHRCGIIVDSIAEIEGAVARILADRPSYSAAAVRCYESVFEFDARFAVVLSWLDARLAAGSPRRPHHPSRAAR